MRRWTYKSEEQALLGRSSVRARSRAAALMSGPMSTPASVPGPTEQAALGLPSPGPDKAHELLPAFPRCGGCPALPPHLELARLLDDERDHLLRTANRAGGQKPGQGTTEASARREAKRCCTWPLDEQGHGPLGLGRRRRRRWPCTAGRRPRRPRPRAGSRPSKRERLPSTFSESAPRPGKLQRTSPALSGPRARRLSRLSARSPGPRPASRSRGSSPPCCTARACRAHHTEPTGPRFPRSKGDVTREAGRHAKLRWASRRCACRLPRRRRSSRP